MSDPSLPLQDGVEAALRASTALASAMGGTVRLYTIAAPHDAPFPFLEIGDDQILDDSTECMDSSEAYVTVHAYARGDTWPESRRQVKQMAAAVRAALNTEIEVEGFTVTEHSFEGTRHLSDPADLVAHSVIECRFLLDPA